MRKIILLLVGILLVIELSLRLLGNIYWLAYTAKPNRNDKDKVRILCIGESTTFGVGGGISDDYPSQLGQILDAKYPNKFSVYNRGVPGITSSLILLNLKRFLAETNPNLVILLCASNDSSYRLNVTNSLLILKDKNNFISTVFFKLCLEQS